MSSLTVDYILSFKTHQDTQYLDEYTINYITKLSLFNDNKHRNNKKNQNNQLLKNPKMQILKDNLDNRVNLILNKLSENNMDNLLLEFVNNIGNILQSDYENIQKTFYLKMISEINFMKIYLSFLININTIYTKVFNYSLKHFIDILETKFIHDYVVPSDNEFIITLDGETRRINNLLIIKNCITVGIMSDKLTNECSDKLLNQTKYLPDVYYWFNDGVDKKYIDKIKNLLSTPNIQTRDKVLLENLFVIKQVNKVDKVVEVGHINKDTLQLEINNILEEYILMENYEDVVYFIEKKCTDAIKKNKLCLAITEYYFIELNTKLLDLMKRLFNSKMIFHTNIKSGISLHKKKTNNHDNYYKQISQII